MTDQQNRLPAWLGSHRNRWILSILILVALGGITYYALSERAGTGGGGDRIVVGAILPLTGDLAYLGSEERSAIQFAVDRLNSVEGATPIELLIEDSKGTSKDGVAAYQKLRQSEVKYLITGLTIVSEAVQPLTEQDGVLQVALSVDPDLARRAPNVLRPYYGLGDEMRTIGRYISSQGAKKVSALYINVPESERAVDSGLLPVLREQGIAFGSKESYGFGDVSFRDRLIKLRAEDADYIVTVDFGFQYPAMLRDAQELGMRGRILGGLGLMTAPQMPAELMNGIVFAASSFVVSPTESYNAFKAEFEQRSEARLTFDGVYAYDATMMLGSGVRDGKTDAAAFSNMTYDGISGAIEMDRSGSGKVAISLGRFDEHGVPHPLDFQ